MQTYIITYVDKNNQQQVHTCNTIDIVAYVMYFIERKEVKLITETKQIGDNDIRSDIQDNKCCIKNSND